MAAGKKIGFTDGATRSRPGHPWALARGHLALNAFCLGLTLSGHGVFFAGCVPPLPLDNAACPCAPGYHCCPVENRCLALGTICPLSRNCPIPPTLVNTLEIGATDVTSDVPNFVPLPPGGRLQLIHGPQGGYHANIQVRLIGLDPGGISLTRSLFDPAQPGRTQKDALRYQSSQESLFCDGDRDWLLLQDQRTYVCPSLVKGQAMQGRDLLLRIDAADREGRTLSAYTTIHPDCPDGDAFCVADIDVGCGAP